MHHAEQGDAEGVAGDGLAKADGEGIVEKRGREAVADACLLPSDQRADEDGVARSEEHTSELQSPC